MQVFSNILKNKTGFKVVDLLLSVWCPILLEAHLRKVVLGSTITNIHCVVEAG